MTDTPAWAAVPRFLGPDGIVQRVRLAAYAWVEDNGSVLLTRISADGPGGGLWTLPGGGLDFGEEPHDGLVREVDEETGYAVEPGEVIGVRSAVLEPGETVSGHRVQAVGILYRACISGGDLRSEVDGSSDLADWVPLDRLDALPKVDLLRWAIEVVRSA